MSIAINLENTNIKDPRSLAAYSAAYEWWLPCFLPLAYIFRKYNNGFALHSCGQRKTARLGGTMMLPVYRFQRIPLGQRAEDQYAVECIYLALEDGDISFVRAFMNA